jgi:replicative DNA helicase
VQGAPTGYIDLDRMSKGLKPGEMFVVAARPSMGKTSLMMNIAEHICVDQGVPSMVFSCEMTAFQIVQRLVFSRARFAMAQLGKGFKPRREDLLRIKRAAEEIAASKLFVDDTPGLLIDTLRAKARRSVKSVKSPPGSKGWRRSSSCPSSCSPSSTAVRKAGPASRSVCPVCRTSVSPAPSSRMPT